MKRFALPVLLVLGACGESPLAADQRPDLQSAAAAKSPTSATVSARPQVVALEFVPGGQTAQATFKARFSADADPSAQMDGGIIVVSAVDGPMPVIGGESLNIEITRAVIDAGRMVQFEGVATVSSGRVVLDRYAVTGSTQGATNPDYIVWDIVGGNGSWEFQFIALTRISN